MSKYDILSTKIITYSMIVNFSFVFCYAIAVTGVRPDEEVR